MSNADHCTGFPEYWKQWYLYNGYIPSWRRVYIGDCCKIHDNDADGIEKGCSSSGFAQCLWKKKIVGGILIFIVASVACWVRLPSYMKDRV